MFNGCTGVVGFQVALGNVGLMVRVVYQHVIPGSVLGRACAGHALVPLVATLESRIHIHDDPPVMEQPVMHQLADMESCARVGHGYMRGRALTTCLGVSSPVPVGHRIGSPGNVARRPSFSNSARS